MSETNDGKEIVDRLLSLMRSARQESVRLKACVELRDWLFGKPSRDAVDVPDGLRGNMQILFMASFGRRNEDPSHEPHSGEANEIEGQRIEPESLIPVENA